MPLGTQRPLLNQKFGGASEHGSRSGANRKVHIDFAAHLGRLVRAHLTMELDSSVSWQELKATLHDIAAVAQDDGPDPVVPIRYTNEFVEVMDLFRGALQCGELSQRTLLLSEHAIRVNPANYTAWYFRRKILNAIDADWAKELEFCRRISQISPKNYQLWHHRREVATKLNDPSAELEHSAVVLLEDPKNYHAWSHRQWVLSTFSVWDKELEYVHSLLLDDPRNNSAWNQRYFVIERWEGWSFEVIQRELEYAFRHIQSLPENESPWNYVVGLMEKSHFEVKVLHQIVDLAAAVLKEHHQCRFAAATLVDAYQSLKSSSAISKALEMTVLLSSQIDSIREEYWKWRHDCLSEMLKSGTV